MIPERQWIPLEEKRDRALIATTLRPTCSTVSAKLWESASNVLDISDADEDIPFPPRIDCNDG
jgi:hypothetical protein